MVLRKPNRQACLSKINPKTVAEEVERKKKKKNLVPKISCLVISKSSSFALNDIRVI